MEYQKEEYVTCDHLIKMKFKVGKIVKCTEVNQSNRLLCFQVEVGDKTCQILSGLKGYYEAEEVIGKKVMVLENVKTTRNNKMMAFLTLEDLVGSVEVIVFPKDYESKRELFVEDSKVLIQGRASVGDDPVGKLICERVIPFSAVPKELWLKFPDKETYVESEREVLELLRESEGSDSVIIYLERERAKKVLPANWNVNASDGLIDILTKKLGEINVRLVEKKLEKIGKMN